MALLSLEDSVGFFLMCLNLLNVLIFPSVNNLSKPVITAAFIFLCSVHSVSSKDVLKSLCT